MKYKKIVIIKKGVARVVRTQVRQKKTANEQATIKQRIRPYTIFGREERERETENEDEEEEKHKKKSRSI